MGTAIVQLNEAFVELLKALREALQLLARA
jgi:hypothetical protein